MDEMTPERLDRLLAFAPTVQVSARLRDAIIAAAPKPRASAPAWRWLTSPGLSASLAAACAAGVVTGGIWAGVWAAPQANGARAVSGGEAAEAVSLLTGEPLDASEG